MPSFPLPLPPNLNAPAPSAAPASQPTLGAPAPAQPQGESRGAKIARLFAAGMALGLGPQRGGMGILKGLSAVDEQRRVDAEEQQKQAMLQQAAQQAQAIQQQQFEEAQRKRRFDYIKEAQRASQAAKTPEEHEQIVTLYDSMAGQVVGAPFRPGALRGLMPYNGPTATNDAQKVLDQIGKGKFGDDVLSNPDAVVEGVLGKERVRRSVREWQELAGTATVVGPANKPQQVSAKGSADTQATYERLKQNFVTDHRRDPDGKEDLALWVQAKKVIGQADDRPAVNVHMGGMNALYAANDPKAVADAIIRGERSPETGDLGRGMVGAVDSILANRGFNKARAVSEWKATQRFYSAKQSTQQLRIRQSADVILQSTEEIDRLADEWKGGNFKALNRATLEAAKQGAMGPDAASLATRLDAQITETIEAMANVYMGGNSPTERAMMLAEQQLRGDWSHKVLKDSTALLRKNTQFRLNAIDNIGPSGISPQSPYVLDGNGGNRQAKYSVGQIVVVKGKKVKVDKVNPDGTYEGTVVR